MPLGHYQAVLRRLLATLGSLLAALHADLWILIWISWKINFTVFSEGCISQSRMRVKSSFVPYKLPKHLYSDLRLEKTGMSIVLLGSVRSGRMTGNVGRINKKKIKITLKKLYKINL